MNEEVDISQLIAFADSIDFSSLEQIIDMQDSADVAWNPPVFLQEHFTNMYSRLVASRTSCVEEVMADLSSPPSPIYRARASLFGNNEQPLNIELCGENSDPRSVCIVDQPGRYAQFKHWFNSGKVTDDTRRITKKEDSWQLGCWLADDMDSSDSNKLTLKSTTTLDRLLQQRTQTTPLDSPVGLGLSELRAVGNVLARASDGVSRTIDEPWREKSFLLGAQVMVGMHSSELTSESFPQWCLWFNDKLCAWGLGDRSAPTSATAPAFVNADIDLSYNSIGDTAIEELLSLLHAFQRVRVKTLRVSDVGLTDVGLLALYKLPYLQHLMVESNNISARGVVDFVERAVAHRQEYYEVLLAQDAPDERVLDPLFMTVEYNCIDSVAAMVTYFEEKKLSVCMPDSLGCQPLGLCKTLGAACQFHLYGLGCQNTNIENRY